jgi:hypothetical protein
VIHQFVDDAVAETTHLVRWKLEHKNLLMILQSLDYLTLEQMCFIILPN